MIKLSIVSLLVEDLQCSIISFKTFLKDCKLGDKVNLVIFSSALKVIFLSLGNYRDFIKVFEI